MKTGSIILILICALLILNLKSFAKSNISYDAGTTIDVGSGADVCADTIAGSGSWTGNGTICGAGSMRLRFTALIEGFYNQSTNKMVRDTVMVYLRVSSSPYTRVDSAKVVLDSLGYVSINFNNAPAGSYYLVIKHRNSIETWSKTGGEAMVRGTINVFNFTISQSQAYGNNLVLKGTKYCVYSGDVNQDEVIDGGDLANIDNDASTFTKGYVVTDVNGDLVVDGSDLSIDDNNASNFVSVQKPPGAGIINPTGKEKRTKREEKTNQQIEKNQELKTKNQEPTK
jgi:hypothetical protein